MPVYGKRAYYARKRKAAPRKRVYKRKATSVARLNAKVNALSRKVAGNTNTVFMWSERANNTPISSPFTYYNLLPLSGFAPTFGDDASDLTPSNKLICKKLKMDVVLNASNETDFISGTMFVVSFKSQGMVSSFYDPITGTLNLTAGTHYVSVAGQTRLNPRFFNIHFYRRWNTGNGGVSWGSTGIGDKNMYMKRISKTFYLNYSVVSPSGNWRSLVSPIKGEENRFLLNFNDDSALDGESVRISVMSNLTGINPN